MSYKRGSGNPSISSHSQCCKLSVSWNLKIHSPSKFASTSSSSHSLASLYSMFWTPVVGLESFWISSTFANCIPIIIDWICLSRVWLPRLWSFGASYTWLDIALLGNFALTNAYPFITSRNRTNGFSGNAFVPMSAHILEVSTNSVRTWWSSTLFLIERVFKSIARELLPRDPRLLAIWIALLLSWKMTVGYSWYMPNSAIRFRKPNISVEQSNWVTHSAQQVDGAVNVCFFETKEMAAPFIITIRHPCGLGIRRLASAKAYITLSPCGSNPFE